MTTRDRLHELNEYSSSCPTVTNEFELEPLPTQDFQNQVKYLHSEIDRIDVLITELAFLHSKSSTLVSPSESSRLYQQIDTVERDILHALDNCRNELYKLHTETNESQSSRVQFRRVQQRAIGKRLQAVITKFTLVKGKAREEQKERIRREIKIAQPEWSRDRVEREVEGTEGASGFQTVFYNSKVKDQQRVLDEVRERQAKVEKMERDIAQIVDLFNDLQVLLTTQQDMIDHIETEGDFTVMQIEGGNEEIRRAIRIRKSSRRKRWLCCVLIFILMGIVALILYFERCQIFGSVIKDPHICPK